MENNESSNSFEKNFLGRKIDFEEVEEACKSLKDGKAGGVDKIFNELIRYGGLSLKHVMWYFCNKCFEMEDTPSSGWREFYSPFIRVGTS